MATRFPCCVVVIREDFAPVSFAEAQINLHGDGCLEVRAPDEHVLRHFARGEWRSCQVIHVGEATTPISTIAGDAVACEQHREARLRALDDILSPKQEVA